MACLDMNKAVVTCALVEGRWGGCLSGCLGDMRPREGRETI